MIRRCFLAALLFCAVSCPMMAQGGKVNVLYLDGTAHEVQMSQVAKLIVADGNVKLLSKSGATVATHAVKNVDKIELNGSTAGMVQLTKQSPIILRSNGYTITAEGMTDGKLLEVYAANGSLAAQYNGAYTEVVANENHFIVDGKRYEMRAAFAEKKADGVNFYLTPGNIGSANELDNCYYYVRLFVPQSNMDGSELDVQGNKKYELTFVDNVTDVNNPQTFSISNDALSSATGTISVLDNGDGTYTIKINVANLGNSAARTLDVVYVNGTPKEYSLAVPSNYTVADGKPVDLKSAVLTHDDAEGVYTIYLSAKAGVTTLAGMADADIVVTMPDAFANDNSLHGFSGDETNAKISIKYAGDTYSQATVNGTNSIALGGNAKLSFADGKADVDFMVFSIKKYKGALKGHYEGNVTRL